MKSIDGVDGVGVEEVGAEEPAEAGDLPELPHRGADARERLGGEPAPPERARAPVRHQEEARQGEDEEEQRGRGKGRRLPEALGDRRHAVEADDRAAVAEPDAERGGAAARRLVGDVGEERVVEDQRRVVEVRRDREEQSTSAIGVPTPMSAVATMQPNVATARNGRRRPDESESAPRSGAVSATTTIALLYATLTCEIAPAEVLDDEERQIARDDVQREGGVGEIVERPGVERASARPIAGASVAHCARAARARIALRDPPPPAHRTAPANTSSATARNCPTAATSRRGCGGRAPRARAPRRRARPSR